MGFFKELEIEVVEMYDDGYEPTEIAKELKLSVSDVKYIISSAETDNFDYDDSMDGDAESALASAGFGTDEDYGYYGE